MGKQKILKPIHPGDILKTEFLEAKNLTVDKLAKEIKLDKNTLEKLIKEEVPINFNIAFKLGSYLMSAKFWLNLQEIYEKQLENYLSKILEEFRPKKTSESHKIIKKQTEKIKKLSIENVRSRNEFQKVIIWAKTF